MGANITGLVARAGEELPNDPAALCMRVNDFRDARLVAGFADSVTGKTFQCDPVSVGKWTAIGASAGFAKDAAPATEFSMIAADNSVVTLSASDAYTLLNGRLMPWVSETMLFARAMKDAILAGEAPGNITAGWP